MADVAMPCSCRPVGHGFVFLRGLSWSRSAGIARDSLYGLIRRQNCSLEAPSDSATTVGRPAGTMTKDRSFGAELTALRSRITTVQTTHSLQRIKISAFRNTLPPQNLIVSSICNDMIVPLPGETYRLAFPSLPHLENPAHVSYGRPHQELCANHVANTFDARRVYILASGSLAKNTIEVTKLINALGSRFAGMHVGMAPHTPWDEVASATMDALEKKADCLVTIGGGSLVDGAKSMLIFMANNVTTVPGILEIGQKLAASQKAGLASEQPCASPSIPLICIPTTLSGGEYTYYAGGTDPTTHHKLVMYHPFCGPTLIINDPALTITTPEWVWLSTGVRGIDHCVESFCRTYPADADIDAGAVDGFRLIVPNLLRTKNDWHDPATRLQCMLGVNAVTIMLKKGAMVGGSHGIGHQLGPLGVGHGQTSCVLLPSVMKYNARVNSEKQERLKQIMWGEAPIAEVLARRGLKYESSDVGDALDAIFRELGMPRSLKEVGVGRDKFDVLAMNSLKDPCCKANPIPLERTEQVLEILEMCAGH
nr:ethanolamine utilization protein eutg [Quercus suber]